MGAKAARLLNGGAQELEISNDAGSLNSGESVLTPTIMRAQRTPGFFKIAAGFLAVQEGG
jgi:hypothetical protein